MTTEIIKTEISTYIATVTIDRPPVNAMNRQMFDEMAATQKDYIPHFINQ